MKIQLIAVGKRMPGWVQAGCAEYVRRMPAECRLQITEVAASKRTKSTDTLRAVDEEGRAILSNIDSDTHVVALEVNGQQWDTVELSKQLDRWMQSGQKLVLMVGGADGLSEQCRQRAQQLWSLSPLTLPHTLVRIVVTEALYRASSLLRNHPYHRE